jgi:hypothetical protein
LLVNQGKSQQTLYLVRIDPLTATPVYIDSLHGITGIDTLRETVTFDPHKAIYYFKGNDAANHHFIYGVDAKTGAVVSQVQLDPRLIYAGGFEFEETSGGILTVAENCANGSPGFMRINPTSGSVTLLYNLSLTGAATLSKLNSTYDRITRTYFFESSTYFCATSGFVDPNRYFLLDGLLGNYITSYGHSPVFEHAHFNGLTGELFGIIKTGSAYNVQRIGSVSFSTMLAAALPGVSALTNLPGLATLDARKNNFTIVNLSSNELLTVNLSTGQLVANPSIKALRNTTFKLMQLKYDDGTGYLYGLHLGKPGQVTLNEHKHLIPHHCEVHIIPNHYTASYRLTLEGITGISQVRVLDGSGQLLFEGNAEGPGIEIPQPNEGFHVLEVYSDNVLQKRMKFAILK